MFEFGEQTGAGGGRAQIRDAGHFSSLYDMLVGYYSLYVDSWRFHSLGLQVCRHSNSTHAHSNLDKERVQEDEERGGR